VPDDAGLEMEAYVEYKDLGLVVPVQAAVVKVDAFASLPSARSSPW
jgi:hypothetical protein